MGPRLITAQRSPAPGRGARLQSGAQERHGGAEQTGAHLACPGVQVGDLELVTVPGALFLGVQANPEGAAGVMQERQAGRPDAKPSGLEAIFKLPDEVARHAGSELSAAYFEKKDDKAA